MKITPNQSVNKPLLKPADERRRTRRVLRALHRNQVALQHLVDSIVPDQRTLVDVSKRVQDAFKVKVARGKQGCRSLCNRVVAHKKLTPPTGSSSSQGNAVEERCSLITIDFHTRTSKEGLLIEIALVRTANDCQLVVLVNGVESKSWKTIAALRQWVRLCGMLPGASSALLQDLVEDLVSPGFRDRTVRIVSSSFASLADRLRTFARTTKQTSATLGVLNAATVAEPALGPPTGYAAHKNEVPR